MDPARESRAEEIFAEALETPEADRRLLLERRCGADAELLARVESLLRAHAGGRSVFESGTLQKRIRYLLARAAEGSAGDAPPTAGETPSQDASAGDFRGGRP